MMMMRNTQTDNNTNNRAEKIGIGETKADVANTLCVCVGGGRG